MKKIIYLMASVITMAFCACTDNKDEITLKLGTAGLIAFLIPHTLHELECSHRAHK